MRVTVFAAGACSAPSALVTRGASWRREVFPGGVALIDHPQVGPVLVDTGFATRERLAATAIGARAFLALLRPRHVPTVAESLSARGVASPDVHHVVLTHAHHDHMGGLLDIPNAHVHATPGALTALRHPPRGHAAAYAAALAPPDLDARLRPIAAPAPVPPLLAAAGFDAAFALLPGTVAVPLPGHAAGQIGVWIDDAEAGDPAGGTAYRGPLLFAADAAWRGQALDPDTGARSLPPWAWVAQESPRAWTETLRRLRALRRLAPSVPVVLAHDPATWPASARTDHVADA